MNAQSSFTKYTHWFAIASVLFSLLGTFICPWIEYEIIGPPEIKRPPTVGATGMVLTYTLGLLCGTGYIIKAQRFKWIGTLGILINISLLTVFSAFLERPIYNRDLLPLPEYVAKRVEIVLPKNYVFGNLYTEPPSRFESSWVAIVSIPNISSASLDALIGSIEEKCPVDNNEIMIMTNLPSRFVEWWTPENAFLERHYIIGDDPGKQFLIHVIVSRRDNEEVMLFIESTTPEKATGMEKIRTPFIWMRR